jgi:hypothetical protein
MVFLVGDVDGKALIAVEALVFNLHCGDAPCQAAFFAMYPCLRATFALVPKFNFLSSASAPVANMPISIRSAMI